jgi:hypothetical protein
VTRTFATDSNNDLVLDRAGALTILVDIEAVAADCRTAIQAQLGEMMFAVDQGMPMFATAWNDYNPAQFEAAARVIMLGVPGVLSVDAFAVERVGESLRYTATIRTAYGEAALNGGL